VVLQGQSPPRFLQSVQFRFRWLLLLQAATEGFGRRLQTQRQPRITGQALQAALQLTGSNPLGNIA